ncbi:MAG TPA: CPBP family intramembrane glutamic endopeptidase [Vicinamibacterales bacterium]|nr:CPBP family intramembrane glutamic endopeptidase [Vicinamibacterales bacterium]
MLDPAPEMMEPPAVQPPVVLPVERAAAALEVLLCSGFPTQIVIVTVLATFGMQPRLADGRFNAPFVFALTLLDTLLLVGLVCFFFRAHRESIREQLFGARRIGRELLVGLALVPASFGVVVLVLLAVQLVAPSLRNVPQNPLAELARTRIDALVFAFVAMIAGGVREEVQRGFILRRFERFLGGGMAGLVIFSCLFGLGHLEQGRDVAIATAVLGAFWGLIFLRRRSIAAPMVGHAGFNLLQVAKFLVWGA